MNEGLLLPNREPDTAQGLGRPWGRGIVRRRRDGVGLLRPKAVRYLCSVLGKQSL